VSPSIKTNVFPKKTEVRRASLPAVSLIVPPFKLTDVVSKPSTSTSVPVIL
jgi:hypothetical protein